MKRSTLMMAMALAALAATPFTEPRQAFLERTPPPKPFEPTIKPTGGKPWGRKKLASAAKKRGTK